MKLAQYQVDAFASRAFEGNPAAVCPLERWLDDALLQAIAEENNLSETAFFVPTERGFALRWFTPVSEVDLCGHATLAAAHVIFEAIGYAGPSVTFETRSGDLTVERKRNELEMNFPARPPRPCAAPDALADGLGQRPLEVLAADDYLAVFEDEATVRSIRPDHDLLGRLDLRGVVVTAPGSRGNAGPPQVSSTPSGGGRRIAAAWGWSEADFVSRFFAPKLGVPEDPVTGSAHCELAPYWAGRLGRNILNARQVSRRGGEVRCELRADRVLLSGRAVTVMVAELRF